MVATTVVGSAARDMLTVLRKRPDWSCPPLSYLALYRDPIVARNISNLVPA
jgi:hypothetical protein